MSDIRKDCLYTKDHEWVKKSATPRIVVVGITDFAQSSLGDVTYVQLPTVGKALKKGESIGSVESVKAVSDIYAPLSGKVLKVNSALDADPSVLNSDPFGAGWILELEVEGESEFSALLSPDAYANVAQ
jgi:glycine cleavage system H protein